MTTRFRWRCRTAGRYGSSTTASTARWEPTARSARPSPSCATWACSPAAQAIPSRWTRRSPGGPGRAVAAVPPVPGSPALSWAWPAGGIVAGNSVEAIYTVFAPYGPGVFDYAPAGTEVVTMPLASLTRPSSYRIQPASFAQVSVSARVRPRPRRLHPVGHRAAEPPPPPPPPARPACPPAPTSTVRSGRRRATSPARWSSPPLQRAISAGPGGTTPPPAGPGRLRTWRRRSAADRSTRVRCTS